MQMEAVSFFEVLLTAFKFAFSYMPEHRNINFHRIQKLRYHLGCLDIVRRNTETYTC